MKIFFLSILFLCLFSCNNRPYEYRLIPKNKNHNTLNIKTIENGIEVTKEVERTKLDSLNTNQLADVNLFLSKIQSSYPQSSDFIFIKYYPGKDKCNSTGLITRDKVGKRDLYFRSEIQKRNNVTASWVYKDIDGLERFSKEASYHLDKDNIIENTFFKYHYPCSSYAILHNSGLYYAYFGESYYLMHLEHIDLFMDYVSKKVNLNHN